MIESELQYNTALEAAENFKKAIKEFDFNSQKEYHPIVVKAMYDALVSQYETLTQELSQYREENYYEDSDSQ